MTSIPYTVIRSDRRTLSLQIRPDGQVLVRSPRNLPDREIRNFVAQKQDWLIAHLQRLETKPRQERLTAAEIRQLGQQALRDLPERTARFAPLVGVTYGRITIRMQKTRWGSCSGQGNLNYNLLLMLAPESVRDYVVVHELCHRKQMNHSPNFWAEVERVLPDYRTPKQWLKENGSGLMARGGF